MAAPTWRFKTASGESCDPPPPPEPEPEGLFPALDGSELASFFLCCSAEETRGLLDPRQATLEFEPGPPHSPPGTRDRKQAGPGAATAGSGEPTYLQSALESLYGADPPPERRRPPPLDTEALGRRAATDSPPVRPKAKRRSRSQRPPGGDRRS